MNNTDFLTGLINDHEEFEKTLLGFLEVKNIIV